MLRHTRSTRCPICEGANQDPRGQQRRCFGYTSDDGLWVRCTREEFAGSLQIEDETRSYVHKFGGSCNCGTEHAPDRNGHGSGKPILLATYEYRDEHDKPLYRVLRYLPKSFSQQRWDEKTNDWVGGEGAMRGVRRVLYRLPEVLVSNGPVLIVEGEKDADNAWALGHPATCNVGGAGKWRDEYSISLEGRECFIIPDKDKPGEEHAKQVEESLSKIGIKAKLLELSEKDLTKWIEEGGTAEELEKLIHKRLDWQKETGSPLLSGEDLKAYLEMSTDYLVEPWIVRGAITQVQGDPKAGKSVFALYLSVAAAMGHSAEFMKVKGPLNVLYLHYEDATSLFAKRIDQFMRGLQHQYGTMPVNLIASYFPRLDLGSPKTKQLIMERCQDLEISILVIDTLSYVHEAEENSASEMRTIMYALKEIAYESKVGIVYLHHVTKGSDERSTMQRGRGSSVITAAADIVVHWGNRNGTDTTPVEVQSKFESQLKLSVDYIKMALEEGAPLDRMVPVRWEIRSEEKSEPSEERAKCLVPIAEEYEKTSQDGISATQLKSLSRLKERTFYKYLKICLDLDLLVETGKGKSKRYYAKVDKSKPPKV